MGDSYDSFSDDQDDFSSSLTDDRAEYESYYDDEEDVSDRIEDLYYKRHLRRHRGPHLLRRLERRAGPPPNHRPLSSHYQGQTFPGGPLGPSWPSWADPDFQETHYRDSQRTLVPSEYPQTSHPAQGPTFREAPPHERESNFWNQWKQFESGSEHQPQKSLVSARKPWIPNKGQPTYPKFGKLEGPGPQTTEPYAGLDIGQKDERTGVGGDGPFDDATFQHAVPKRQRKSREEISRQTSKTEIAATRVDLTHDPSQASKDMSIRLDLDIEEDWDDDLEEFCRLRRLGLIKEAKEHFRSTLEHVGTIPYIRVQYAEMLLSSGNYRDFQNLGFLPEFPPGPSEETLDDRSRGKLVANYALLDLLSQRPIPEYLTAAWNVVRNTLSALVTETTVGSTEIQLLSLCLRVLDYLKSCTQENVVGPVNVYTKCLFNWRQLYHDLVGESCVWDFKDLFMAAVSVFGWQDTLVQFFGTAHLPKAMDTIIKDWSRPFYDEALVMGLLDLFTSLILHDHSDAMKTRNLLLLHHARTFAESAERNDPELMRSRPFVQWLLAKSVLELKTPPERPDGVRLEHFSGLKLNQGSGIHLPIYVPSRHTRKPDWDMFFSRTTPAQRRVVEVAVRAADQIGDYNLQAECMRLLILQSQDPKQWMNSLANLQLETQGDKEGYLATCLARYLVATDAAEETNLLRDLEKPRGAGNALYFEQCENASLTWAWSMVRILLTSANGDNGSVVSDDGGPSPFLHRGFSLDGSKLPPYVAEFARIELGIPVSPSMAALSLEDLKPQGRDAEKHVDEVKRPDAELRDRFGRGIARPEDGPRAANPWNPAAFETWGWMPNYNGAVQPLGPPPPPAYFGPQGGVPPPPQAQTRTPWQFYSNQQPDPLAHGISPSLEVSGWPSTWFDDARRQAQSTQRTANDASHSRSKTYGQGQEPSSNEAHVRQETENGGAGQDDSREAGRNTANDDQKRTSAGQDGASSAQRGSNKDQKRNKAKNGRRHKSILEELESCEDGYDEPETEKEPGDGAEERPHVSVEDGATHLNFPDTVLDDNSMTLLLTNRKDPTKLKAFIVQKGGVFETIASSRSHRRRDDPVSADQEKSKFNVRTTSVSFDMASSSSESTVILPRSSRKARAKSRSKEPSTQPPDAETRNDEQPKSRNQRRNDFYANSPQSPPEADLGGSWDSLGSKLHKKRKSKTKTDDAEPPPPTPPPPAAVEDVDLDDLWGFKPRKEKKSEKAKTDDTEAPPPLQQPQPPAAKDIDPEDPWATWGASASQSRKKKDKSDDARSYHGPPPSPPWDVEDVDLFDIWSFKPRKERKRKQARSITEMLAKAAATSNSTQQTQSQAKASPSSKPRESHVGSPDGPVLADSDEEGPSSPPGPAAAAAVAEEEEGKGVAKGETEGEEKDETKGEEEKDGSGVGEKKDVPKAKKADNTPTGTGIGKGNEAVGAAGDAGDGGLPPRAPSPPPSDTPGDIKRWYRE